MRLVRAVPLVLLAMAALVLPAANASYTVVHVNVTVSLGRNTSAQVNEVYTVLVSNSSLSQYTTNRVALNLSLSYWQTLIGSSLVEHIINPSASIYDFRFVPGPAFYTGNGNYTAYMLLSYRVNNVTTVSETAPRVFVYNFQPKVFNFQHTASGEFLSPGAQLNIAIPRGSKILSVFPVPDGPPAAFTYNYTNVTTVSWFLSEPLSRFNLAFVITESVQAEVLGFFTGVYRALGVFTYVIIAAIVIGFIVYTYYRTGGK